MGQQVTADKIGKTDYQPVQDASEVLGSESAKNSDAMADVTDTSDDTWSETYKEKDANGKPVDVTYNYSREKPTLSTYMDRVNLETGEMGNARDLKYHSGASMTAGDEHDPSKNIYKSDKYLTKAPIEMESDTEKPAFDDLAFISDKGEQVDYVQGTVTDPNVTHELESGTIFIEGTTHQEDVRQCNVGDCYFLAALLQIIHYDPSKIVNMMHVVGDEITTTFYHKEKILGLFTTWKETKITTKLGLLKRDHSNSKNAAQMNFMGSKVRLAYDPHRCVWSSSIEDQTLKIDKTKYYEAALWVNCLEQAYTLFSQKYGRYGQGVAQDVERYKAISGGFTNQCFNMFFGKDAKCEGEELTASPVDGQNDDLVKANEAILSELLDYAKAQDGDAKRDIYISAGITEKEAVERLKAYAAALRVDIQAALDKDSENEELQAALKSIDNIIEQAGGYFNTKSLVKREGETTPTQEQIRGNIDLEAIALSQNPAVTASAHYSAFQNAVGCVTVFTATNGPNKVNGNDNVDIFIYNGHAYNIDHVELRDAGGNSLNSSNLKTLLAQVDVGQSVITMQNPHGKTRPAFHVVVEEPNKGTFDTTLESFLMNVGHIRVASVKNRDR